jgi:8-oxo-dGTP pyrophosphatase MutT (NUDIX family)
MVKGGLPEIIRKTLAGRNHVPIEDRSGLYRHAAVLIPLLEAEGEYRVLFTKRTSLVDAHKGQISFPGGRIDATDASPEEAALREAEEEIGLRRKDVEVLGRTDDVTTMSSNFVVSPFVGLIPYPYDFMLNTFEVDRILTVPFSTFLPDGVADRLLPIDFEGKVFQSLSYVYDGDVIWGATARIMKNLIRILGDSLEDHGSRSI